MLTFVDNEVAGALYCVMLVHGALGHISWCSILLCLFWSKRAQSRIVLGRAPLIAASEGIALIVYNHRIHL